MTSPLRPQLLRLATRRLLTARNSSTRSILSVAAGRESDGALTQWTTNQDLPRYSLSLRSFSTTLNEKEEKKTTEVVKTKEDTPTDKEEMEEKELHKESLQFQAETRQLLDIVTHSLYTDKEGNEELRVCWLSHVPISC